MRSLRSLTTPRAVFSLMFLACTGLMAFGLVLQHVMKLEPCPLCIVQRYAFILTGVVALLGAMHDPKGWGRFAYAILALLFAGTGAGVAARQIWLQHHPQVEAECAPGLDYMLESFPLTQLLPKLFKGEGECAKVVWEFLGLSIPEWALVWFVALVVGAAWIVVRRERAPIR